MLSDSDNTDSTAGTFYFLTKLSDQIQSGFEEVLDSNCNKKRFLRVLSEIFVLLLNTNIKTVEKIKNIYKIAMETTVKIWSEQN